MSDNTTPESQPIPKPFKRPRATVVAVGDVIKGQKTLDAEAAAAKEEVAGETETDDAT